MEGRVNKPSLLPFRPPPLPLQRLRHGCVSSYDRRSHDRFTSSISLDIVRKRERRNIWHCRGPESRIVTECSKTPESRRIVTCSKMEASTQADVCLVIDITRTSSFVPAEERAKTEARMQDLIDFYIDRIHTGSHQNCQCQPEIMGQFIYAVSSNTNPAQANMKHFVDLKKAIKTHATKSNGREIAIVINGLDGWVTNVGGFAQFFEPFAACNIRLYILLDDSRYASYRVEDIRSAIKALTDTADNNNSTNETRSACADLVSR